MTDDHQETTFFDDDRLWIELNNIKRDRRAAALRGLDALAALAELRVRVFGISREEARRDIYRVDLLDRDLDAEHIADLNEAAHRVWDEMTEVGANNDGDTPPTDEERAWADRLRAHVKSRLNQMRLRRVLAMKDDGDP